MDIIDAPEARQPLGFDADGDPLVPAFRQRGRLYIHCPFCDSVHIHGDTAGPKAVHCLDRPMAPGTRRTGYVLREVSEAPPATVLARMKKAHQSGSRIASNRFH